MGLESCATWDRDRITWGGWDKGVGTILMGNNLGSKVKDLKGMSFEEVKAKFKTIWEQIEGGVSKILEGEVVRNKQEKDKIGTEPDKNGKRGEVRKSQE
nr:hypothetical protein [Tanacetum cinerariifolium]